MVAAVMRADTVFSVLGDVARRRTPRSLALQCGIALGIAAFVGLTRPNLWAAVAIAITVGVHGAWGLLARVEDRSPAASRRAILVALSALGTLSAIVGLVGFAVGAFTGTGKSPYDPCGPGARQPSCQAYAHPKASKLPIP